MSDRVIANPIINSPYYPPKRHFAFDIDGITNEIVPVRRPSSYFVPVLRPRKRGQQLELELPELTVDQIRERVDLWRKRGRPHVTHATRRLLYYWTAPDRDNLVLFCQLEAAETR